MSWDKIIQQGNLEDKYNSSLVLTMQNLLNCTYIKDMTDILDFAQNKS